MNKIRHDFKRTRFAAAALTIAIVGPTSACQSDSNGIDPQGETPSDNQEIDGVKIWQVKWDNPVVGSLYEMPTGAVEGYAIRNGSGWEYNKFDLELEINDADSIHRMYTWPSQAGTFGDDETSFFFETHGMKLEPIVAGDPMSSVATASAFHDTWNQPELLRQDALGYSEGRFQLDPVVGLVPLRAVVLNGPGISGPGFSFPSLPPGWTSRKSSELLFDDRWRGNKGKNNTSPYFPDNVVTPWTHIPGKNKVANHHLYGGGRHLQPDRVFDQCDVQFRMLSYHTCTVPAELLHNGSCDSPISQTAHARKIRDFIDTNCDVPGDVPLVIFVGSLGGANCLAGRVQGAQIDDSVFVTHSFADKKTLSHELGHLLGLKHTNASANLMAPGQGIDLNNAQCPKINANAKTLQDKHWRERVFTGEWQPLEFPKQDEEQLLAQELWAKLDLDQLSKIKELLGPSHFELCISVISRDVLTWRQGKHNLESLIIANYEQFEQILTEEQLATLNELFER